MDPAGQNPPAVLGYSTGDFVKGQVGRHRDLKWCLDLARVACVANVLMGAAFLYSPILGIDSGPADICAAVLWLVMFVPAAAICVYWLVWIHQTHAELRHFTGGKYPISPAMALSFCFVPLFNLFWFAYLPWRMASELDKLLGPGRIDTKAIWRLEVGSVLCNFAVSYLSGPMVLLGAVAMVRIQNGLNELWRKQS